VGKESLACGLALHCSNATWVAMVAEIDIIFVGDEPGFRDIAIPFLLKAGVPEEGICVAKDGDQALQHLQKLQSVIPKHPILMLVDVKIPNVDGRELAQKLKEMVANKVLQRTPILTCCSSGSRAVSFDDPCGLFRVILPKPFGKKEFKIWFDKVKAMTKTSEGPSNPFHIPTEKIEFFWFHDSDQQNKSEKSQRKDLRVWEKSTKASRCSATRKLGEEEMTMAPLPDSEIKALALCNSKIMEEEVPDATFLTTIATRPSIGLLEPLRKSNKEKGQQDVRDYIQKKREVFLVQMALDDKHAEISRLDEKARLREEALAKSEQMLEEDSKRFQEELQQKIEKADKATKYAKIQAKKKQDKLQQIKQLKSQIAAVQSETAKLREVREESYRYKGFIEKLTPSEWKEQQRSIKMERKSKRREDWITDRMASVLHSLSEEERCLERSSGEEPEADAKLKRRPHKKRKEDEEERLQRERERQLRRRRLQKRKDDEQKRILSEYHEVSSEEEYALFFQDPSQLMDTFTELEEKNLFLIQSLQETDLALDELQQTVDSTEKDMGSKVQQLKENIRQLEQNIAHEKQRCEELQRSYEEKSGTKLQDKQLETLKDKVKDVYQKCGFSTDHGPDVLQMLGSIESKLDELIQAFDDAYQQDVKTIRTLEKGYTKKRRECQKAERKRLEDAMTEEKLKKKQERSKAEPQKMKTKQVMYRSFAGKKGKLIVKDSSDDEAHAQEHRVFGMYIDRKSHLVQTDPPILEDANGKPT